MSGPNWWDPTTWYDPGMAYGDYAASQYMGGGPAAPQAPNPQRVTGGRMDDGRYYFWDSNTGQTEIYNDEKSFLQGTAGRNKDIQWEKGDNPLTSRQVDSGGGGGPSDDDWAKKHAMEQEAAARAGAMKTIDSILGTIGREGGIHQGMLAGLQQEYDAARKALEGELRQQENIAEATTGQNMTDRRIAYNAAERGANDEYNGGMSRLAQQGGGGSAAIQLANKELGNLKANENEGNYKFASAERENDLKINQERQQNAIDLAKAHDKWMEAKTKEDADYYNRLNDLYNQATGYGAQYGRDFINEANSIPLPDNNWHREFTGQSVNYKPKNANNWSHTSNDTLTTAQKSGGKW